MTPILKIIHDHLKTHGHNTYPVITNTNTHLQCNHYQIHQGNKHHPHDQIIITNNYQGIEFTHHILPINNPELLNQILQAITTPLTYQ